jgi:mono/diheme cytochrome c family protein
VLAAAGCPSAEGDRIDTILALTGDPVEGERQYGANCESCHGVGATGGSGPSLVGEDEPEEFVDVVLSGEGSMPGFDALPDQDIADMLAYVQSL